MEQVIGGLTAVDVVIVLIFVFFALYKGGTGFYRSLVPLIATLGALAGALALTGLLLDRAMELAYPLARKWLFSSMDLSGIRTPTLGDISSQLSRLLPATVTNLLHRLGLDVTDFVETAISSAPQAMTPREVAEWASDALLLPATASVVRGLLFVALFIVLKILLTLLLRLVNPVFKLPVIGFFDWLGGAVIGLAWCAACLYALCWVTDLALPDFFDSVAGMSTIISSVFRK